MTKLNMYDLESYVKTIHIDSQLSLIKVTPPANKLPITAFKLDTDALVDKSIKQQLDNEALTNDEDIYWVDGNKKIGNWGEEIANKYLQSLYGDNNVSIVSDNDALGYDIEVTMKNGTKHCFEIKVAFNHVGFHISSNQLKKANKLKQNYFIFFINIDSTKETITGFIIKNPYEELLIDINVDELTSKTEHKNIIILPSKFYIQLHSTYLNSLEPIDLINYIEAKEFSFKRNEIIKLKN